MNFSIIKKKRIFLILNSYVILLNNNSIATLKKLFKLAWINDVALTQFASEFSMRKNRNAISTIWFVLFDCSFVCEWCVVDMSNLMFDLLNRVFQNSKMNFEFLFDMISSEISQFVMNNRSSNVSA